MARISAGLLMYRFRKGRLQVFLAHPGGPFFARKNEGYWTIPKGEPKPNEDLLEAAKREFQEETGIVPTGPFIPLKPVKQKGGKVVNAWRSRATTRTVRRSSVTRFRWNGHLFQDDRWGSRRWIGRSS
jgi:predicted NUDIX family NTP pyrophosphohydrolase